MEHLKFNKAVERIFNSKDPIEALKKFASNVPQRIPGQEIERLRITGDIEGLTAIGLRTLASSVTHYRGLDEDIDLIGTGVIEIVREIRSGWQETGSSPEDPADSLPSRISRRLRRVFVREQERFGEREHIVNFDEGCREMTIPSPEDLFLDPGSGESSEAGYLLNKIVLKLSNRERSVIDLWFGEDLSAIEVGDELGLNAKHVRYVKDRALRKLRRSLLNWRLEEYR